MLPKYQRPPSCYECQLNDRGFGFAPPSGPPTSDLLFVGEALGYQEALAGFPFAGAAGGMFERILKRSGIGRETTRVANCVSCQPPGDWLDGAPWEYSALSHCRQYLNPVLAEPHKVIVTLGSIPLKQILDLHGAEGIRVQDFHGTVHRLDTGQFVVPTYHPSHLQRGAINLLDVVRFDVNRARQIARAGRWDPTSVSLLLDPPPHVFALWASVYRARLAADPDGIWLSVDIETPDKEGGRDEGELTADDVSTKILRVNFSYTEDEGITVPYEGPYIELIDQLLTGAGIILMWNKRYDEPRLRFNGHAILGREVWDLMWLAHHLQSDLPLGLGFWAPFYSTYGAWKHLGKVKGKEAEYAAVDGFQTTRVGHGLVKDAVEQGVWSAFYRHTHIREQYVLRPAQEIGLLVDVPALDTFHDRLQGHAARLLTKISSYQVAGNCYPKNGYAKSPEGKPIPKTIIGKHKEKGDAAKADYIAAGISIVSREIPVEERHCLTCGKAPVPATHNCLSPKRRKKQVGTEADGMGSEGVLPGECDLRVPTIQTVPVQQLRWFYQLPFNPDASQQILRYIKDSGEAPGKAKKTKKDTGNKETLRKLSKKTGDPIYKDILDYKAVKKVDSTYAVGAKRRVWADGRLHPTITQRPSTLRDSCVNPNIQNVVTDRGGPESLAAGFRECIVAAPGCRLLEVDYSGIEGVETGWLAGDPDYIRLAYLGVHAYLASHLIGKPASLAWADDDLALYFKGIKKSYPVEYDRSKRCVHGNNYGLTIHGMVENFPESFPDLKEAKRVQELYFQLAPKLGAFHSRMRDRAYEHGRLGGPPCDDYYTLVNSGQNHPFAYRHWFWGVLSYRPMNEQEYRKAKYASQKRGLARPEGVTLINQRPFRISLGEDSKRVIAFYPQSIAAGRLKEAQIDLFHPESEDFIGDRYFGRTPFRAPIHDSLLLEVPDREWDHVLEQVVTVMRRPEYRQPCPPEWGIGDHLRVGVAAKAGRNWGKMEDLTLPEMLPETAREQMFLPTEEEDWEDQIDLGTQQEARIQ